MELEPLDPIGTHAASTIHFISVGDGPPVILIHGMASSRLSWEAMLPALAGYHRYALDLPGHGDSLKPAERAFYRIRPIFDLVEEWIESLALSEPPVLIGHSLGGYLSLSYALHHPEVVRSLVLINPFVSPYQISPLLRMMQRRARLGERAIGAVPESLLAAFVGLDPRQTRRFPSESRRQIAVDVKRASPRILNILESIQDLTPRLPEVRCPVAMIWGTRDPTLIPASFPDLLARLPNALGYPISGTGHQPHMQVPQVVNALVLDFLQNMGND